MKSHVTRTGPALRALYNLRGESSYLPDGVSTCLEILESRRVVPPPQAIPPGRGAPPPLAPAPVALGLPPGVAPRMAVRPERPTPRMSTYAASQGSDPSEDADAV